MRARASASAAGVALGQHRVGKGLRKLLRHGAPLAANSEVVLHEPASAGARGTPVRWSATRWRDAQNSASA